MHTNHYGTSFAALDAVKGENKIAILDIDVQGALKGTEASAVLTGPQISLTFRKPKKLMVSPRVSGFGGLQIDASNGIVSFFDFMFFSTSSLDSPCHLVCSRGVCVAEHQHN